MKIEKAKIIVIGELKKFDSGFQLVEFVVETNEEYPQKIILQCVKENADNFIKYNKVGDIVDVSINLRGREWVNPQGETKYFNTIVAWKVFKSDSGADSQPAAAPQQEEIDNDLPF